MDVLQHAPALTADEASAIARRLYGVDGHGVAAAQRARSELPAADGRRGPLRPQDREQHRRPRPARGAERRAGACRPADHALPACRAGSRRRRHHRDDVGNRGAALRPPPDMDRRACLSARCRDHPPELLEDLGRKIAELDAALDGFDHPAIHRDFYWDLAKGLDVVRELAPLVADPGMRALVTRVADQIDSRDAPRLRRASPRRRPQRSERLQRLVVSASRKVTGILDFGDIVHSYAIADLAIAVAYAVLGKDDPLAAAVVGRQRLPGHPAAGRRRDRVALRARAAAAVHERLHRGAPAEAAAGRRVSVGQPGSDRADAARRSPRSIRRRSQEALRAAARQKLGGDAGGPQAGRRPESLGRVPAAGEGRPRVDAVSLRRHAGGATSTRTTTCRTSGTAIRASCRPRSSRCCCSTRTRGTCTTACRRSRSGSRRRCPIR